MMPTPASRYEALTEGANVGAAVENQEVSELGVGCERCDSRTLIRLSEAEPIIATQSILLAHHGSRALPRYMVCLVFAVCFVACFFWTSSHLRATLQDAAPKAKQLKIQKRFTDPCQAYNGTLVSSAAVIGCCSKDCGSFCGASNCQNGPGAELACCTSDFWFDCRDTCTDNTSCSRHAPCRLSSNTCARYDGIKHPEENACCAAACGDKCGTADCWKAAPGVRGCCTNVSDADSCQVTRKAPCSLDYIVSNSTAIFPSTSTTGGAPTTSFGLPTTAVSLATTTAAMANLATTTAAVANHTSGRLVSNPCAKYGGIKHPTLNACCAAACGALCGTPDCWKASPGVKGCCKDIADASSCITLHKPPCTLNAALPPSTSGVQTTATSVTTTLSRNTCDTQLLYEGVIELEVQDSSQALVRNSTSERAVKSAIEQQLPTPVRVIVSRIHTESVGRVGEMIRPGTIYETVDYQIEGQVHRDENLGQVFASSAIAFRTDLEYQLKLVGINVDVKRVHIPPPVFKVGCSVPVPRRE